MLWIFEKWGLTNEPTDNQTDEPTNQHKKLLVEVAPPNNASCQISKAETNLSSRLSAFLPLFTLSSGSSWMHIPHEKFAWISSGADGEVWAVKKNHQIYRRMGVSRYNHAGTRWQMVPGGLVQIDAYNGQVWGISWDQKIWLGTMAC